jgi:type II secretory pathway component HofQ
MNLDWLLVNKNKISIQKLIDKREKIVIDVTVNGKFIRNYQRQLSKITKEIEKLYITGLRSVDNGRA